MSILQAAHFPELGHWRGFRQGVPRRITPETRRLDKALCRCTRCPSCGRRGLRYVPFTDGWRYRIAGVCLGCRSAMEL